MYENFLSKYQSVEAFPIDYKRGMTNKEKLQERRDRILGREQKYLLKVVLFTQEKKLQPKVEDKPSEPTPTEKYGEKRKDTSEGGILRPSKIKRLRGLVQVAKVHLRVFAYSPRVMEALRWKLATRGTSEFRQLYPICVPDRFCRAREADSRLR